MGDLIGHGFDEINLAFKLHKSGKKKLNKYQMRNPFYNDGLTIRQITMRYKNSEDEIRAAIHIYNNQKT